MFKIGEIKSAKQIGRVGWDKYIWQACPDCNKERWVRIRKGKPVNVLCVICRHKGANNFFWRGGRSETKRGYILVYLQPDDFFYSMADAKGYIMEHRLVVAK